jgi:hypothetical protein
MPSGFRAGVMYGLPKIHKNVSPMRPIISAVKTYNYELAKYLDQVLKPFIDKTYMLVDTYDFVNKVSKLDINSNRYMVSFDVESLFTNVPSIETIEIILNEVYKGDTSIFNNLTREELKKFTFVSVHSLSSRQAQLNGSVTALFCLILWQHFMV